MFINKRWTFQNVDECEKRIKSPTIRNLTLNNDWNCNRCHYEYESNGQTLSQKQIALDLSKMLILSFDEAEFKFGRCEFVTLFVTFGFHYFHLQSINLNAKWILFWMQCSKILNWNLFFRRWIVTKPKWLHSISIL